MTKQMTADGAEPNTAIEREEWARCATACVERLARKLYGAEWSAPVSQLTGINLRTCQRVHASAEAGEENKSADGLLRAMREKLMAAMVTSDYRFESTMYDGKYAPLFDESHPEYLTHFEGEYLRALHPYEARDLGVIVREYEDAVELSYPALMGLTKDAINSGLESQWIERALEAVHNIGRLKGSLAVTDTAGRLHSVMAVTQTDFYYGEPAGRYGEYIGGVPMFVESGDLEKIQTAGLVQLSYREPLQIGRVLGLDTHDTTSWSGRWLLMIREDAVEAAKEICDKQFVGYMMAHT